MSANAITAISYVPLGLAVLALIVLIRTSAWGWKKRPFNLLNQAVPFIEQNVVKLDTDELDIRQLSNTDEIGPKISLYYHLWDTSEAFFRNATREAVQNALFLFFVFVIVFYILYDAGVFLSEIQPLDQALQITAGIIFFGAEGFALLLFYVRYRALQEQIEMYSRTLAQFSSNHGARAVKPGSG